MDTGMITPTPPPGTNPFANRPNPFAGGPDSRKLTTFGAYQLVGRLNDIPVGLSEPKRDFEKDKSDLSRFAPLQWHTGWKLLCRPIRTWWLRDRDYSRTAR
jgi:creatinine amidohydrolase